MRLAAMGDVNNQVDARGIYPEAGGSTTGTRGSALTPYTAGGFKDMGSFDNSLAGRGSSAASADPQTGSPPATSGGVVGKPLTWWLVLVLLLVGLMFTAQRLHSEEGEFRTVKLSLYNILVITLSALIGFGVFKAIFGRFNVPGLSPYIAAV